MRLRTITDIKEELAAEIEMSYSGLAGVLPRNYYNQTVKGENGKKEYNRMAQHHYHFRSLLAASPRLSSTGVKKLLQSRLSDFDRLSEEWKVTMKTFLQSHPCGIDEDLHSYTIADLELLGRCISTIPYMLPKPNEMPFLADGPAPTRYAEDLLSFVGDMEHDLELLLRETAVSLDDTCTAPFREALTLARQSISVHLQDKPSEGIPFSVNNLVPLVGRMHYTNTPYFWKDILSAMGHKNIKITDGAGDGNRDVESTFQGNPTLSQIKTVRSPIGEETVRQFASTCRTYSVPHGYFVTTLRFVREAHLGQWPQLPSDRKAELRQIYTVNTTYHAHMVEEMCQQDAIAKVELVDGQDLARYAFKYRIGATIDDMIDESYWDTLTIPGFRRRTPAYHPVLSHKESDSRHSHQQLTLGRTREGT